MSLLPLKDREELILKVARALAEIDANHEVYHQRPYAEWARKAVDIVEHTTLQGAADFAEIHLAAQRRTQEWAALAGWEDSELIARATADTLESFINILKDRAWLPLSSLSDLEGEEVDVLSPSP